MTSNQDPDFAVLDDYIRAQLIGASETYAEGIDIEARLQLVLEDGPEDDDPAAANSSS
jgi:hypothetical protein